MGMTTHVIGFKPPDARFKQMYRIWEMCKEAKVHPPLEVDAFFGGETPDPRGVEVDLNLDPKAMCVTKYNDPDSGNWGFDVDITKLPKDVTVVRFFNNY